MSHLLLSTSVSNCSLLFRIDWQFTFSNLIGLAVGLLGFGIGLVGDENAKGGPGEFTLSSIEVLPNLEKLLLVDTSWRSNRVVLKFGMAHCKEQLLDSMQS